MVGHGQPCTDLIDLAKLNLGNEHVVSSVMASNGGQLVTADLAVCDGKITVLTPVKLGRTEILLEDLPNQPSIPGAGLKLTTAGHELQSSDPVANQLDVPKQTKDDAATAHLMLIARSIYMSTVPDEKRWYIVEFAENIGGVEVGAGVLRSLCG